MPCDLVLTMKKAVGFRNIAVHNYEAINWAIMFAICHRHVADFAAFAVAIGAALASQEPGRLPGNPAKWSFGF